VIYDIFPIRTGQLPTALQRRVRLALRRGAALLAIATLVFVTSASSLIDGIDSNGSPDHFEVPGGPLSQHSVHNHAFCAVLGATPVLPGGAPRTAVAAGGETRFLLMQTGATPVGVTRTTCRSRAPPRL
jgi:hypothetical protein